jgi:hypothetical protein
MTGRISLPIRMSLRSLRSPNMMFLLELVVVVCIVGLAVCIFALYSVIRDF